MGIKESTMLILTDAIENNNKFYELILNDDSDNVNARWGRVGAIGQSKIYSGGLGKFNELKNQKIAKGYVKANTISTNISKVGQDKIALAEVAKRDMVGQSDTKTTKSNVLVKLVDRLAEMNRHQIVAASNGNIKIDETGMISTPLGLVTASTIGEARELLEKIEKFCSKKDYASSQYIHSLEGYLKLIPQKVPPRRGWYETFFTDFTSLTSQNSLLDQLEGSLDLYKTKEKEIRKQMSKNPGVVEKVFSTHLSMVEDKDIISRINRFYLENRNAKHVSAHLKLKNVFELHNDDLNNRFKTVSKEIGNVKSLWHGTRAFNVLSILKNGLIIPKSGGSYHITGRMFGNGVYFSDQSTKSLNYSYGYWDGSGRDDNCFMFVADVAMGKEYVAPGPGNNFPQKGYHSTFAKANKSGVMNNEMIVYDIKQVNLKYLCEFSR